jgi:hypothetical protein
VSSPCAEGVGSGLTRRLSMATGWGGEARSSPSGGKPRAWRRASAELMQRNTTRTEALVNTGELSWPDPDQAAWRVRQMQPKLHHWAVEDCDRRFDDVFNLVQHPDFLTVAWERVRGNKGAR